MPGPEASQQAPGTASTCYRVQSMYSRRPLRRVRIGVTTIVAVLLYARWCACETHWPISGRWYSLAQIMGLDNALKG